jgi:hypothetical protein
MHDYQLTKLPHPILGGQCRILGKKREEFTHNGQSGVVPIASGHFADAGLAVRRGRAQRFGLDIYSGSPTNEYDLLISRRSLRLGGAAPSWFKKYFLLLSFNTGGWQRSAATTTAPVCRKRIHYRSLKLVYWFY